MLNESISRCEDCSVSALFLLSRCKITRLKFKASKTPIRSIFVLGGVVERKGGRQRWRKTCCATPLHSLSVKEVRILSRMWEARRESGRRVARLEETSQDRISMEPDEGAADLLASLYPAQGGMMSYIDCKKPKQFSHMTPGDSFSISLCSVSKPFWSQSTFLHWKIRNKTTVNQQLYHFSF